MTEPTRTGPPLKLRFTDGDLVGNVKVTDRAVIGRGDDADVHVDDPKASRHHAEIVRGADGWQIRDLGSSNGTYVNGRRISAEGLQLHHGDVVRVGKREATVVLPDVTVLDRPDSVPDGEPVAPPGDNPALRATQPGDGAAVAEERTPPAEPAPAGPAAKPMSTPPATSGRTTGLGGVVRSLTRPGRTTLLRDLSRTTRRALIVATVAVVVAIGVAIAALAGAFSRGTDEGYTAAEIVDRVRPSTVLITTSNRPEEEAQLGSGWVINAKQGLIITNGHVAELGKLGVVLNQGAPRPARIVAMHRCADVALLQVADRRGMATMPIGRQADIRDGDDVVAVGFPGSISQASGTAKAPLVTTTGTVSVVKDRLSIGDGNKHFTNVIQTDAAINGGNSGGPLMHQRTGTVIGINTLGAGGDQQNQNYAVAIDRIRALLPDLSRGVSHGWLGLALESPSKEDIANGELDMLVVSVSNPDLARAGVSAPTDSGVWRLHAVNGVGFGDPATQDGVVPPGDWSTCAAADGATGQPARLSFVASDGRTLSVTTQMQ
ncbi:MAG TPA: trypsin-like peptidase domain-containing protein [Baekduia sp.]|nr:trypsin-like peptidase domain-containing protein [Baekduia sp.]